MSYRMSSLSLALARCFFGSIMALPYGGGFRATIQNMVEMLGEHGFAGMSTMNNTQNDTEMHTHLELLTHVDPGPKPPRKLKKQSLLKVNARLIGSTKGMSAVQAAKISQLLEPYMRLDWDGDQVKEESFTECLLVGSKPFITKDTQHLTNDKRPAVAHHHYGDPTGYIVKTRPYVVIDKDGIEKAAAWIDEKMGGNKWRDLLDAKPGPGKGEKYPPLAAAGLLGIPVKVELEGAEPTDENIPKPNVVFWAFDDARLATAEATDEATDEATAEATAKLKLATWISLAEWYWASFLDIKFVIVDTEGNLVKPDCSQKPWSLTPKELDWGASELKAKHCP